MNDAVVQRSLLKLGLRLSRTVGLVVQRSPGKVDASRSAADLINDGTTRCWGSNFWGALGCGWKERYVDAKKALLIALGILGLILIGYLQART